jgi:hypothetical protein
LFLFEDIHPPETDKFFNFLIKHVVIGQQNNNRIKNRFLLNGRREDEDEGVVLTILRQSICIRRGGTITQIKLDGIRL